MYRLILRGICLLSVTALWAGCSASTDPMALPTATPAPTQVIPSMTPTPLPPPTVTAFPTFTPEPTGITPAVEPSSEAEGSLPTEEAAEGPAPTSETEQGTSGESIDLDLGPQIFSADFAQGWPSISEDTAKINLDGGVYRFAIGPFDARFMNTSAVDRADYYVEIGVSVSDCPEGSGYGLMVRQQDANNYYAYIVFCNGTYSLIARVNGSLTGGPLASGALPDSVSSSSGSHTLGVMARGQSITLFYDGEVITELEDDRHESGDIALYAISQGPNVIQVDFDNLEVWTVQ